MKLFLREKREANATASKLIKWQAEPLEQCETDFAKRIAKRQLPVGLPLEINRVRLIIELVNRALKAIRKSARLDGFL